MDRKRIFILLMLALVSLAACNSNLQPPGLTPIPRLGATPVLAPADTIPGQAGAPSASTPAGGSATAVPFGPPNCGKSNCEESGPAITQNLKGDPASGQQIFVVNCKTCHGDEGKGGVPNPGSADGTVPPLSPIDEMFAPDDPEQFAQHIDVFLEHGSQTTGTLNMPAWGDSGNLMPQQIADVIAYVISLNKP